MPSQCKMTQKSKNKTPTCTELWDQPGKCMHITLFSIHNQICCRLGAHKTGVKGKAGLRLYMAHGRAWAAPVTTQTCAQKSTQKHSEHVGSEAHQRSAWPSNRRGTDVQGDANKWRLSSVQSSSRSFHNFRHSWLSHARHLLHHSANARKA